MLYRRFGKTELQIPVISFGGMRSMHSWIDTPLTGLPDNSQENLKALLDTALQHGINHFETAHGYGSSERQLGALLPQLKRDSFILQTKITPHRVPEVFLRDFHESLSRLQVDRIDLLALHGINDYRSLWDSCRKGGCLAAARKLQREGKVRFIGFSGHGPHDVIMEAINHQEDGGFDYCNVHWYYILNANLPVIERAIERDLGIYIISPTDKGGMLHKPPPLLRDLCAPLSPMLFNDTYCLSQPGVHSISVGAGRPDEFSEHLKALDMIGHDRPKIILQKMQQLQQQMRNVTGFDRPDALWHDLPDWELTPGNINLRFCLWLYNLARGWDLLDYARTRYNMLGTGTPWVPGNNCCTISHTFFSEIMNKYPAITEELLADLDAAHQLFTSSI